jgi:DNA (cytosine-5)-methyltransferase 1
VSGAFYNEWERYPAQWIRNLAAAGHVAEGVVDERSIRDVRAAELVGHRQVHFFAGLGGWSYALRLAGWPDDRPVWTASCPCQPFSTAGKQRGFDDDRHLWPVLFEFVRECRPAILFGEQVAGPAGRTWLDAVSADLESAGYAVGAANLCAAGCGAPHIRQRLYFVAVADADGQRRDGEPVQLRERGPQAASAQAAGCGDVGEWLADGSSGGRREWRLSQDAANGQGAGPSDGSGLGHADGIGAGRIARGGTGTQAAGDRARGVDGHVGDDADAPGAWGDVEWIACTDGKSRPTGARLCLLAYGLSARMGSSSANQGAQEGVADAPTSEAGSDEELRALQETTDAQEVQRDTRGHGGVSASPLLRSGLHGGGDGGRDKTRDSEEQPAPVAEDSEGGVRDVRAVQSSTACSSPRRESAEQRIPELADFVRLLPQAIALAQLGRDYGTAEGLCTLLKRRAPAGVVLDAPHKIQAVWRSLGEEDQARVYLEARSRGLVVAPISPLAFGVPDRVGKLRAYGNAIVAPLAAEFIGAVMDVLDVRSAA